MDNLTQRMRVSSSYSLQVTGAAPVFILFLMLVGAFGAVSAQGFAGSNICNYDCPDYDNLTPLGDGVCEIPGCPENQQPARCPGGRPGMVVTQSGNYECRYCQGENVQCSASQATIVRQSIPQPPTLRQIEFWFVRILYAAWALSGIVFTAILMFLGFKYMTSRGQEDVIADVKKRLRNWAIGLALIFLSYPVLNTLFNVIGLSQNECFRNINLPGFTFFFAQACTAS